MCRYYSTHFYSLCAHTAEAAPLPLACCVVLEECAAQQAVRRAETPLRPRALTRSDDSLNNWQARLHRGTDDDSSSATATIRTPTPHPCFVVEFAPGTLWSVPASAAEPLQALCPTCRTLLRQFDARWARMLTHLEAASDAAAAGAFRLPRPTAQSAGLARPTPWPPVLRRLPGTARQNRAFLEQARAQALAERGTHSVFLGGQWDALCAYERMLLAHFVYGHTTLPRWADYETSWGVGEAVARQVLEDLRVVLGEGERRLAGRALPDEEGAAAAAAAAPNQGMTSAATASEEDDDLFAMEM